MADVYGEGRATRGGMQTDDVELREAARSGLRAVITKIVIPTGDELCVCSGISQRCWRQAVAF